MPHLRAIRIGDPPRNQEDIFPFNIPAIQAALEIRFTTPVTFLVGENGSGKSTLLEAIASAADTFTVGSESVATDDTLSTIRQLADTLRLVWRMKVHKGFFLRAEDFFGYVKRLAQIRAELKRELKQAEQGAEGRSEFAKGQARMAYLRELQGMQQQFDRELNSYSHGESFLELFQSRFVPGGLYLLDEPEVPLSPSRQLTLISLLKHMVTKDAQFIIATHSPILMALPGATILSLDWAPPRQMAYEELDHVVITRSFLNDPDKYLRHL